VLLGTELVDLADGPDAVRAVLRDTATGGTRVADAGYVIGADGSRSAVRQAAGIAMRGPDRLAVSATALFTAPLWDLLGPHRYGIYGVDDGTFVVAGRGDRWGYGHQLDPELEDPADYPPDRLAQLIRLGAGVPDLPVQIHRTGAFTFAAQLADRFREGRIFLAGDAAHRVTPRGGTGMNTAIADGFDLGWKLTWVLRGWAGPELLDSYESERRPVAEHNVARSADPAGRAARSTGSSRPTSAAASRTGGCRRPSVHGGRSRSGADAVHRPAAAVLGRGGGRGVRIPAGHRARAGQDDRPWDGHPGRRRHRSPAGRRTGGMVVAGDEAAALRAAVSRFTPVAAAC
jgi:2-polyprenyl-6-methoxyphenol hydroxylase-like FAD-dependent oxidoreductase